MASTPPGKNQWDSTWGGLPREIRLLILEALMQDGCSLGRLATVSREWQRELERHNFARIRLTPRCLVDFGAVIYRCRALVRYIWFCLELDHYDCTTCAPSPEVLTRRELERAFDIYKTKDYYIVSAFADLFFHLSKWEPNRGLTLDISIYSPRDSEHWFKYLTFMPDTPSDTLVGRALVGRGGIEQMASSKVCDDPQHGWVAGHRRSGPPPAAIGKVFSGIMEPDPSDIGELDSSDSDEPELAWWDPLPSVPAVTSLLLRQQNRRRWKPRLLAHMFSRFPRLQEVHYEPWREWDSVQRRTDRAFEYLFKSIRNSNKRLKRLVVFENFNQQYPAIMQQLQFGEECDSFRNPTPAVSRMVALASLKLEHLAASFIVDASHFFEIEPSWKWPKLTSLVLTSKLLTPDEDPAKIRAMLRGAAEAVMKMPRLKTLEIWNGRKGLAALFKYQAFRHVQQAVMLWKGTWNLTMDSSSIQAWEAAAIKSHGDAIHYLMLSGQVIRPISLQQIRREQKLLEGVPTV
ncbi:hypothetical protein BR93DRAFT_918646 [Coniochaeta sp. PMI_546]|nr:hypothetical protein BR93DRAFT_918646 [Coniochaeta sp. PMI_546]